MKRTIVSFAGATLSLMAGSLVVFAAQAPGGAAPPRMPMSFFVTSVGLGKGGDLGGLAGADAQCQALATAAGSTKTWHGHLSTPARPSQPPLNAPQPIGSGPWYNANGGILS